MINKLSINFSKKKKYRIKIGFDPTNITLHLGHFTILNKLKELQKFGHLIFCIIGTYTAQIGDPSGKNKKRNKLKKKIVLSNCKIYKTQIFTILQTKINITCLYNNCWLERLTSKNLLKLLTYYTVSQILERRDFKLRIKNQQPLTLSELIYPIIQGYDSVILNCDLEIGGIDQKFNLSVGRFLQKKNNQIPQNIYMINLLPGIDGSTKMSKTIKNTIDLNETKENIFEKLMKIPDSLIKNYYILLLNKKNLVGKNIIKQKLYLAVKITKLLFGKNKATEEKKKFINYFYKKKIYQNITHNICIKKNEKIFNIIYQTRTDLSKKKIKQLFIQNAIKISYLKNKKITMSELINKECFISIGKKIIIKVSFLNN